jgi:hypothetical protein
MSRIFAGRSAEKRREGEALVRGADNLSCAHSHGESSRQTGLPPDEEGRTDDFQSCEPNEW